MCMSIPDVYDYTLHWYDSYMCMSIPDMGMIIPYIAMITTCV